MSRSGIWLRAPGADTTVGDIDEGSETCTDEQSSSPCVTAFAVASATAFAGAGARANGVIVGCQKPGKGFLRVVRDADDCRRNERDRHVERTWPGWPARRGRTRWRSGAGGSPGAEG